MYKDLSLKEKSELFKLMVSNGITDINEIEKIYNKYWDGGSVETPQQKLFNRSTIDDTNIKDTKHIRTATLPGIYHYIPFAERYANNFLKKFEHLSNEEIAERLYNNMYQGYNVDSPLDLKRRLEKTVLKNEKESENVKNPYIPEMDALFAEYLNIPKNKRRDVSFSRGLSDSEYKPTKNSRDITYKAFNRIYREDQKALIDRVFKGIDREEGFLGMYPVETKPLQIGENSNSKILSTYGLGTHTIGRGLDPTEGEYVSYYDLWDLAPIGSSGGKDQSLGIGKPINIYDRIYLDDYYHVDWGKSSVPQKGDYYGGYLPELTVIGNKKSKGGKLNKFDEGGNKQTTTLEKPSFFEGDTWKPRYWGTPEYNTPTLKEAIFNAYDDGLHGQDIIWNKKAYEAMLTPQDAAEWRNSRNISFGNKKTKPNSISNPRERMLNTYTPIMHDNNMYYYDTYSRNFYKDNKGTDIIEDPNNDLLYAYYNQYVSPLGKSNNYEDMVKFYIQQMRNTQAQRRKFIIDNDLSKNFMKDAVTITTGKSGTSRLGYSKELIRNIYENLPEYNPNDVLPMDIYTALAIPYVESDFGHTVNSHSDWMGTRGNLIPIFNNDGYELPDDTFYGDLSYGIHTYFNKHAKYNKKTDRKELEGLSRVEFLNKYLAHREDDLFDIELLYNKDMLNHVGESLKKNMGYNKFKKNVLKDKENPNFYKVAFDKARIGKYNPGKEEVYNNEVLKTAAALRKDPELNKTLKEMGIIK